MTHSEEIRKIWEEMKELKRYDLYASYSDKEKERTAKLQNKYEEIETLFGHESTLSKAIIYYLDYHGSARI
jgi:hypothetical protein